VQFRNSYRGLNFLPARCEPEGAVKYLWITLLLPLAMASATPAQQSIITAETPVNSDILHQ
jgi:hypothetical protein